MSAEMLAAALDYAGRGWPVLPLWWAVDGVCSCRSGRQCAQQAKHPITLHGLHDATTDVAVIRSWWAAYPLANIGLRTGVAFDVLDVDGDDGLDRLAEAGCFDDPYVWDGPEVLTSKGFHRYLLPTGRGNRSGVVAHVDYRGANGYVVAPPSVHVSGHRYVWGADGPDVPLEPMPAWLRRVMDPPVTTPVRTPREPAVRHPTMNRWVGGSHGLRGLVFAVMRAEEGQRNTMLNWAAHAWATKLVRGEIDAATAREGAQRLLDAASFAGLGRVEAQRTLRSGWTAGIDGPSVGAAS